MRADGFTPVLSPCLIGDSVHDTRYERAIDCHANSHEIKLTLSPITPYVPETIKPKPKGEMERSEGGSITEGIGQGRVTANLATCEGMIDGAFLVRQA